MLKAGYRQLPEHDYLYFDTSMLLSKYEPFFLFFISHRTLIYVVSLLDSCHFLDVNDKVFLQVGPCAPPELFSYILNQMDGILPGCLSYMDSHEQGPKDTYPSLHFSLYNRMTTQVNIYIIFSITHTNQY